MMTEINNISYCGFYCATCPKYTKKQCLGCKGESSMCAMGYKSCKVRPCCIENNYFTCAECTKYSSVRSCKIYNPLMIRIWQFLTQTCRRKGIEKIKELGEVQFANFMADKKWVTIKKNN